MQHQVKKYSINAAAMSKEERFKQIIDRLGSKT
jgi:hypothetical protein